jgi:hypothetical protein
VPSTGALKPRRRPIYMRSYSHTVTLLCSLAAATENALKLRPHHALTSGHLSLLPPHPDGMCSTTFVTPDYCPQQARSHGLPWAARASSTSRKQRRHARWSWSREGQDRGGSRVGRIQRAEVSKLAGINQFPNNTVTDLQKIRSSIRSTG